MNYYGQVRENGEPHSYTNTGKISFSEYEFKKQGLGASQTYLNARNKLIEACHSIQITHEGGMAKGRYE